MASLNRGWYCRSRFRTIIASLMALTPPASCAGSRKRSNNLSFSLYKVKKT